MKRESVAFFMLCLSGETSCVAHAQVDAATSAHVRLQARVIAVGLPGVSGVRQVGRFHSGGPLTGNPEFLLRTAPGRVLDGERVLVAVASNFGAPRAAANQEEGAVLSIDTRRPETLQVPRNFAAMGTQAVSLGGAVQLYTSQSTAFLNQRHNPAARTAAETAAAGPRYLSINNAFGRPWIANAPTGLHGAGSVSVVDPDGAPLDNAPSTAAGGVFAGTSTSRETVPRSERNGLLATWFNYRASPQLTRGSLEQGALGTAFLGVSPDGSGFAVFAVATADGALSQVHVQDGVDGLAPAGTLGTGNTDPGVIGMAFKWNPMRALYVADAARDRLLVLHLADDHRHFIVARREVIASIEFKQPVDLPPAVPEVANPRFASHTTLAGDSDLYVANRGDGTLLRINQQGHVLARARVEVPGIGPVGAGRIRALAVSGDAQRIWLTLSGELPGFEGQEGALIEVGAFDAGGPFVPFAPFMPIALQPVLAAMTHTASTARNESERLTLSQEGERFFRKVFTPAEGLGPLFNARACMSCHSAPTIGGMSANDEHFARRVARMDAASGRVSPIIHANSPSARRHSTLELGVSDAPAATLPRQANVSSLRMPPALYGLARIDEIPDAAIEAQAVAKGDGIKGRVNRVRGADGEARAGRYGWKADIATIELMVANAFANELGIDSALARPVQATIEDDGTMVRAVVAYLRNLRAPVKALP